jgi:hypothetical protein
MEFEVVWMDVRPNLLSGEPPAHMQARPLAHGDKAKVPGWRVAEVARVGEFWVPQGPLFPAVEWTVSKAGDFVRVPVFAYKTSFPSLAHIFGLGVQVGLAALADLRNRTGDVPIGVLLVLGHECTDLRPAEERFRCYVGLSVRTR